MDWENERYVRVYTRDTADILAIGWEGRALFNEILRKVDRAGLFDSDEPEVISELIRMPLDVVERALPKLLKRGMVERLNGWLLVPNFLEAQEAKASESQRSREHRARRRDQARAGELLQASDATIRDEHRDDDATIRDEPPGDLATIRDEHSNPRDENVTPSLAVPSLPSQKEGRHDASASALALAVVTELNRLTGKNYSPTSEGALKDCRVLAKDKNPPTPEQGIAVVQAKHHEWGRDPKMSKQLKPSVLLRPSNFRKYLEEDVAAGPIQPGLRLAEMWPDDSNETHRHFEEPKL